MFIGHHAVAFAAKKFAPRTSLTALLSAALFLDLLWPLFLLMGIEKVEIAPHNTAVTPLKFVSYPWSHSLLMSGFWGILFAGIYYAVTRYRTGSLVIFLCVISHWLLDFISHGPDMPLYPGNSPRYGLGLWYSITATMLVELLLFIAALVLYTSLTKPRNRWGTLFYAAYIVTLLLFYVENIFGPPPSSSEALAKFALLAWIIIPWAYAIDLNRAPRRAFSSSRKMARLPLR